MASSPLLYKGHAYAIGGHGAICVALDTGKVLWHTNVREHVSSPILADGKILALGGHEETARQGTMLKADPAGAKVLATANLGMLIRGRRTPCGRARRTS